MMQGTKKAAPVLQHQDGKVETGPVSQTAPHLRHNDTTTIMPGQAVHITDFLRTGQAHATPLRDLVSLTGQDGRTVRLEIERARRQGIPVLSNSKDGYWLGESRDEIAQFVRGMKHRAKQIRLTANAVGKAAGIGK